MFKVLKIAAIAFGVASCGKLRLKASNNDAECSSFNCYCADKGYWAANGPLGTPAGVKANSTITNSTQGNNVIVQNLTVFNQTNSDEFPLKGLNQTNYPPFQCSEGVANCFNTYGNCKKMNNDACGWDVYSTQLVDCLNRNAACRRISVDSNVTCVHNKPVTIPSAQLPAVSASASCYDQDNIRCLLYSNQTCGWNDLGKVNRCLQDLNQPILTKQN